MKWRISSSKEWQCVGRVEQVENPGDYFTMDIAGEPVLVVRDRDKEIRALSPVCRHRAQLVASGEGNCNSFSCPYHGWTYSLSGELVATPEMADTDNFDTPLYSLPSVRLEVWEGFIFINFDPQCSPLAPAIEGLSRRLANYKMTDMKCTWRRNYDLACNWKLFMDGQEAYHLPYVHGETIPSCMKRDDFYLEEPEGPYEVMIFRSVGTLARRTLSGQSPFPLIEGLSQQQLDESPYSIVYPTFQIPMSNDGASYLYVLPQGPQRCKVMTGICFPKATTERPDFEEVAKDYYSRWDVVNYEDIEVCESSQRGLQSKFYRSGRYSHMEQFPHRFHNYVMDRVLKNSA